MGRTSYREQARQLGLVTEYSALQNLRKGTALADPGRLVDVPEQLCSALGLDRRDTRSVATALERFEAVLDELTPTDRAIAVMTWNIGSAGPGGVSPPPDADWTERCRWAIDTDFLQWTDPGSVRRQSDRVILRVTMLLVGEGRDSGALGGGAFDGSASGPVIFRSMHAARHQIVTDMLKVLTDGSDDDTLLVGGRIRSMSDVVRETLRCLPEEAPADAPRRRLVVYALDPTYTAQYLLPGRLNPDEQRSRNGAYAMLTTAIERELTDVFPHALAPWNIDFSVVFYQGPPMFYCYVLGRSTLYWGPFTWSAAESDWAGPDNDCVRLTSVDPQFDVLQRWFANRIGLFDAEAAQVAAAP